MDPNNSNILYLGTSDRGRDKLTQLLNKSIPPAGLFKSTDGGQSWVLLGSNYPEGNSGNAIQFNAEKININVILVDPVNSNNLYLACDKGLFSSTDAGLNWIQGKRNLLQFLEGSARSLALDTSTSSRILYAGISGAGVYRSTDGGLNWGRILDINTPTVKAALGNDTFGKVVVDIAPPTSPPNSAGVQVIYVSLERTGNPTNNDQVGIFASMDQGTTWNLQTSTIIPINQYTQHGYSFHMAVDPGSPGDGINDIIYLGCVGQARSDDSGKNFFRISEGLHADTHAWAFVKQPLPAPSIVFSGNDGGIFRSENKGTTWTHRNSFLSTALLYNIALKPSDNGFGFVVGAFQDNKIYTKRADAYPFGWRGGSTISGDGGDVCYNANHRFLYGSTWGDNTSVHRSSDDGLTFNKNITPWQNTGSDPGAYTAKIATDPNTSGIVYVSGSQNLWQSFDYGNDSTWRVIKTVDSSCDDIDVARGNGNYVVISIDGKVFLSTNALADSVGLPFGVTFTEITRNLPGRYVTRVRFDPNDPNTIYAVLGGFYRDTDPPERKGHVFRTGINQSTWTDISPRISVPCSALVIDGGTTPSSIYVGTEFGVLQSLDGGSYWSVLDDLHFPRVPVLDLDMDFPGYGYLVAATYGRGVFIFTDLDGLPVISLNKENNLDFGTVRQGPVNLNLQILNVMKDSLEHINGELVIYSVQRLMGSSSFSVLPTPNTPIVIRGGEHVDFTIQYNPSGAGVEEFATIRIISNDYSARYIDVSVTGRQEPYD
jgi:photosystem II stability/assembly factor-like uncharacterized protein